MSTEELCGVPGGPLSEAEREKLPAEAFGLPRQRKYPMPDVSHARNAKARAAGAFKRRRITRAELEQINAKADRIIRTCATFRKRSGNNPGHGNPGTMEKDNPGSTLRTFAWIGLGLTIVGGLGGLAAYLIAKRREQDKREGSTVPERESGTGTAEQGLGLAGTRAETMPAAEPPPATIEVAEL